MRILIIAAMAALSTSCATRAPVSETGFYEINQYGFNVWCFAEDDCATPPLEAQIDALHKMCTIYDIDKKQP